MQQDQRKDVQVIGPSAGDHAIHRGDTMEQIQTVYHTAVRVQKPRDLRVVENQVLTEAELAGELFYYSWKVQAKDGPRVIDGITVHAAMAIARYWGNCVVNTQRERAPGAKRVKYTSDFIDLESGFTLRRIYAMHLADPPARFRNNPTQTQRWADMQDQKAQSISQRNVVQKGVPFYLVEKVKRVARQAALQGIKGDVPAAINETVSRFKDYNVSLETLEKHLGAEKKTWTPQQILQLRSILQAFEDGIETPYTVFEQGSSGPAEDAGSEAPTEESGPSDEEILAQLKGKVGTVKWLDEYVKAAADFAGQSVAEYVSGILEDEKALKGLADQVAKWAKKHGKDEKPPPKPDGGPPADDTFGDVFSRLGRAGVKKAEFEEYLRVTNSDQESNPEYYRELMSDIRSLDKDGFARFVGNFKDWQKKSKK